MTNWQMRHFIATARRCYARFHEESSNPDDREPLPPLVEFTA